VDLESTVQFPWLRVKTISPSADKHAQERRRIVWIMGGKKFRQLGGKTGKTPRKLHTFRERKLAGKGDMVRLVTSLTQLKSVVGP